MGTLDWARRTGGRLGRADRLRLFAQAALANMERVFRRRGASMPGIDVDAVRVPDSRLCRDAEAHAAAACDGWLLNHCLRTYAWGFLLGAAAMERQSARRPRSRVAFLCGLGFVAMIRRAPYAS